MLRARNLPVARYGPRNTCYGQVGHNGARNGARNSPVREEMARQRRREKMEREVMAAARTQFLLSQPRLPGQLPVQPRPKGRPPKGATWDEQTGQYVMADGQPHQWDSTQYMRDYMRDWVAAIKKDDPVRHQKMKDHHAKSMREARKRIREEDPELAKKIREDDAKAKRKARSK